MLDFWLIVGFGPEEPPSLPGTPGATTPPSTIIPPVGTVQLTIDIFEIAPSTD